MLYFCCLLKFWDLALKWVRFSLHKENLCTFIFPFAKAYSMSQKVKTFFCKSCCIVPGFFETHGHKLVPTVTIFHLSKASKATGKKKEGHAHSCVQGKSSQKEVNVARCKNDYRSRERGNAGRKSVRFKPVSSVTP